MFIIMWILSVISISLIVPVQSWPEPLVPKEFVLASNHFGFQLLNKRSNEQELSRPESERENIFFSPFSITTVMSMLQQGANRETFNQLNSVLGFQLARIDKNLVAKKAREAIDAMLMLDSSTQGTIVMKMANAMIVNKNFRINENYNETIQKYFDSELLDADFASEHQLVMATINQWCAEKTNGKIQHFLRHPPSPSTQLALINAIYFKGIWKNQFMPNETQPGKFYGFNNRTYEDIPFMKRQARMVTAYLSELESDLVEMPYEGDDVSMFAILPRRQSSSLMYIRKALNPWYVEAAISRLNEEQEATVIFPRIQVKGRYNLKETLKDMGLVDVFDFSKADLTGISEDGPITVDDVRHAALIDINEEGTEAAASTYVGFVKMSLQPSMVYHFNHPFILFIRHNPSGQILFLGEINKP